MNDRWYAVRVICVLIGLMTPQVTRAQESPNLSRGLVGHWPLVNDATDISVSRLETVASGVTWPAATSQDPSHTGAVFDGKTSFLEVQAQSHTAFGRGDFSIAAWVWTDGESADIPGDLVSQYDPATRRGFQLSLKTNSGVTFNQANYRQLQFGIDRDQITPWRDCGQPGKNSLLAFGLIAHRGELYAGTCEPGTGDSGRVYRYSPRDRVWIDCGSPAPCNAVTSLTSFGGELYVGTGKYRVAGSALAESDNANLGGQIFRYAGGSSWVEAGELRLAGQSSRIEAVSGMVTFQGRQFAGSLYKPAGFFGKDLGGKWNELDVPDGKRVEALAVYNGHLYASSYDSGHVYRFDGKTWNDMGQLGDAAENTQTYSFAVYEGRLYAGTWRSGRVYRLEEANRWTDVGRLGEELEVMGMLVHNGRLMAGTLPLAEVYQFEGGNQWKQLTQLDATPDVKYRRAWTMAEFQGELFCSTLPSGRIFACQAGKLTTWDEEFPTGWQHVTAVKSGNTLHLYVDGKLKSSSTEFNPDLFDISNDRPLRIGRGSNDFFLGRLRDVRLYKRALAPAEAVVLAKSQ